MNCFYHTEQQAVTLCSQCGKGLCPSCATKFTPTLCPECYQVHCKRLLQSNINGITGFILFFIGGCIWALFICYYFGQKNPEVLKGLPVGKTLITMYFGYIMGSLWYGWRVLDRFQSFRITSAGLIVWGFYFVLKLFISCYVGVIATPFQLIKNIRNIRKFSKLKKSGY